jgi:hypothetical protein
MKKKYTLIKEIWLDDESEPVEVALFTSDSFDEVREYSSLYENKNKKELYTLFVETNNVSEA